MQNFIPAIWSAKLLEEMDQKFTYGNLVNRDYEGEIKDAGDRVKINSQNPVTIGDYVKNTDMADPQLLTGTQQELVVDQQPYFNFYIDSIDAAQSNIDNMAKAMKDASNGLKKRVETKIASHYVDVHADNFLGSDATPEIITAANVYDKIVDLKVRLDETDTPDDGRFLVVPAWLHGMLLKAEVLTHSTQAADGVVTNGYIGRVAGFNLFNSNNVPFSTVTKDKYKIMGGVSQAITFAGQVTEMKAYEPEKRFGAGVKGLYTFGTKVTLPKQLVVLTADKG
ncbi:P22 phage major capsid protein family protein [Bacillus badius]|uniref:P22 phage major capsid protein family protein n=1 Tax=Bacillus badius TaxID=1455 RepID=UPI0005ADD1C6|nr:P22 phage major capsid protein family protein [Bacillus badius]KIL74361.1 Phage protein [Bacillus badius]